MWHVLAPMNLKVVILGVRQQHSRSVAPLLYTMTDALLVLGQHPRSGSTV